MIHHLKRATWHLIFWSLLASALGLTAVRLALQGIGHFKQDLTAYVSDMLGTPVKVGRLSAKIRGFTPELLLKNIVITGAENQPAAIQLQEIRIRLDLLALLANRDVLPATSIILVGTKLTVQRNPDGSFSVMGLKAGDEQPVWLLEGCHYEMLQSEIVFQDLQHKHKTLKAAAVDLAITNSGEQHQINAIIDLPSRYGGKLVAAMELQGNFLSAERLSGKFFAETQHIQATAILADYLPSVTRLDSGEANSKLWGQIKDSRLTDLQGDIALTSRARNQADMLQTRFHWYRSDPRTGRWRLDVPHLQLARQDATPPGNNRFSLAGDTSFKNWAGFIEHLDLQDAAQIGLWLLPEQYVQRISQYRPTGSLDRFTAYADVDRQLYAIRGQFKNLASAPSAKLPGFSTLSGQINGTNHEGAIKLTAENAYLNYPAVFRQALPVHHLQATLDWRQDEEQWQLSSPSVKLELSGIRGEGLLRLSLPKDPKQPPFLDWQMALVDDDVSQLKTLLPAKVMKPVDVDWLDAAFVKGRIEQGRILYYGPLGSLKSAVFQALLDVVDVELSYDPEWPHLTGLAGRVSFLQNKMICEASQGHSEKLNIVKATVIHPAIGISKQLQIDGEVVGALPDALAFLKQTPLNEDMGGLITAIQTQGQTKVSLDLDLALNGQGHTRLDGKAQLSPARLQVKAVDLWLERIDGDLKFNKTGVYSDTITATALNRPVAIKVSHDDGKTRVDAQGEADIDGLKNQFPMPFWDYAKGLMAYQLQLNLPRGDNPPTLSVRSNLKGVALDLPKPLAKQVEQSKSLSVDFTLQDDPLLPIAIDYNKQFKAAIKLDTNTQALHSGHLLLGEGDAKQPVDDGLSLEINQERLELAGLGGFSMAQDRATDAPPLSKLIIHSRDALWNNKPLGSFNLNLNHQGNYWLGEIDSKIAQGKVQIPVNFDPAGSISLHLHLLDLSALKSASGDRKQGQDPKTAQPSLQPQQLPLLTINSRKTLWQGVDLGQLSLRAERIPEGMAINQASLNGAEQKLAFSGRWKATSGGTVSSVIGTLSAAKAGQLLSRLDITNDFKETDGKLDFALAWQAPPYDFQIASLSGTLDAQLKNGRILSIEPGFGRLLGLIAMAQWSKRLQLDFRDIFEEGLSFNSIRGNFKINKGIAHTDNLLIDAIPAKISITGDADLAKKTLDHLVQVLPKSADAVPIAGTIVDNLVNLASRTLTGESGEGLLLGSEYYVRGPWRDIKIIPTHKNDGLLQKTWNALTDFPWATASETPITEQ